MRPGSRVQRAVFDDWTPTYHGPIGTVIDIDNGDDDEDGYPQWAVIAWDGGAAERVTNAEDAETALRDLDDVTPRHWVNVYLHDRAYGGPEEGGWWYDVYEAIPEESRWYPTEEAAEAALAEREAWCAEENSQRRSDIGSVISEGRYEVQLEAYPPESSPARRPHYC